MAKSATPQYQLQETTTGLFILFEDSGARLTYSKHASTFPTSADALIAASHHAPGEPVDLVRIDA